MSVFWQPEDNIRLYELWKSGLNDRQIGEIMYYSTFAIHYHRHRLGLTSNGYGNRKWNAADDEELTELWNRGVSIADIAHGMGYSCQTIHTHRKLLKLDGRKQKQEEGRNRMELNNNVLQEKQIEIRRNQSETFGEPGVKSDCKCYFVDNRHRVSCKALNNLLCRTDVCQFYKQREADA